MSNLEIVVHLVEITTKYVIRIKAVNGNIFNKKYFHENK